MKATKKTFIMFLVVVLLAVSMPVNGLETVNAAEAAHLIINQVYGGGGKSETPITNSFIELYNPTQESVSLNGYSIVCGDATLSLSGNDIVEPGSSYLIVGNAEDTTDELITYDLPRADKTWEYTIDNKNYTISLKNGEVTVDEAVADSSVANLKISKQKSLRRINYTDTDSQSDWEIVVWEKESVTVDQVYVDTYAPRNSRGEKGNVHSTSEEQEPVYTPVDASDKKVTGFNNSNSSLDMEQSRHFCYKRNHT